MLEWFVFFGIFSFAICYVLTGIITPRLKRAGITGEDENKPEHPQVPEMGGFAIVAGFTVGVLAAIFASTFLSMELNLVYILAALVTIHMVAFVGVVDDLLNVPQWLKAFLPLGVAIPLVAVSAVGSTAMIFPFIGEVDFGIFYILVLVPIGVAVASNLTNMYAGYNGMESGMGAVIFLTIFLIGFHYGAYEMSILAISMLGALLAFLPYNFFPAKVFPGDVGNLSIGAALASTVIIGNFETVGAILMVPYALDFFIKLRNRLPHTYSEIRDGKLYPKDGKIKGLVHLVMKLSNGVTERDLALIAIGIEGIIAIALLLVYF